MKERDPKKAARWHEDARAVMVAPIGLGRAPTTTEDASALATVSAALADMLELEHASRFA